MGLRIHGKGLKEGLKESLVILDYSEHKSLLKARLKIAVDDDDVFESISESLYDWCVTRSIVDYTDAVIVGVEGHYSSDLDYIYAQYYERTTDYFKNAISTTLLDNKIIIGIKECLKVMTTNSSIIVLRSIKEI